MRAFTHKDVSDKSKTKYKMRSNIDGEWKCVAKAYNQNSNTISK